MKIPKKIKIGGQVFKIQYVTMENWGETHFDEKIIKINKKLLDQPLDLFNTLAHEMVHATFSVSGCGFACFGDDVNKEESVVRSIENIYLPAILSLLDHKIV
jgi:hypothetical protein